MAQTVNNLPAIQETLVRSLGQDDPLEAEMATHCIILAWRVLWREEPGVLRSKTSWRVSSLISEAPFNPLDTVLTAMPKCSAMSLMVGIIAILSFFYICIEVFGSRCKLLF